VTTSGCRLDAPIDTANLTCDDGRCPDGFACVDAHCLPDDDGPGAPCNPVSLIADDFESLTRQPQWAGAYQFNGASAEQLNGRLRVTLPAAGNGPAYAGYATKRYYDLRGRRIFVEVARMVDTASHAQALLQIIRTDGVSGENAGFEQQNGTLTMFTHAGGREVKASVPYDALAHRFWQLRERDGTLLFETSPDGHAWTERGRLAAPFDVSLVRVELSAGVFQGEASPGMAEFDGLNGGVSRGRYCKVAKLVDDFDDGVRDQRWARSYEMGPCKTHETGGVFVGEPPQPADAPGYCAYASAAAYDLTASQLAVEVVEMIDTAPDSPGIAYFKVSASDGARGLEMVEEQGAIKCRQWIDYSPVVLGQRAWDASKHRFWKLAERAGEISWQTSPDGSAWTTLCTAPTSSVDVDDLEVEIGVGITFSARPGQPLGRFRVDRLNLLP